MESDNDQVYALLQQLKHQLEYCHTDLKSKIKTIFTSNIQDPSPNVAAKTEISQLNTEANEILVETKVNENVERIYQPNQRIDDVHLYVKFNSMSLKCFLHQHHVTFFGHQWSLRHSRSMKFYHQNRLTISSDMAMFRWTGRLTVFHLYIYDLDPDGYDETLRKVFLFTTYSGNSTFMPWFFLHKCYS